MTMNRRVEKLEAAAPENAVSYRVLRKRKGDPDPVIDPPLGPNEKVIVVSFVAPSRTDSRD